MDGGELDFDNIHAKFQRISRQTVRAAAITDHMRIFGRKSDGELQSIDPLVDLPDSCTSVMD